MRMLAAAAALALSSALTPAAATDNPWSKFAAPAAGAPQAIGKYTAGCLLGGVALSNAEPHLITMRPQRNRYYGHPAMIRYLRELAGGMSTAGHGTILVGDLAMPRGGPTLTNHVSHQSGLDVDIWFEVLAGDAELSERERRERPAPSFVDWPAKKLLPSWGAAQDDLVRLSATREDVQRVLVNPVIKRHLCKTVTGDRSWLRKVRPWWGHADHIHTRLYCPPDSPECKAQIPTPPGDGCDKTLTWWLVSADRDAAKRRKGKKRQPKRMPKLPAACDAVRQAASL